MSDNKNDIDLDKEIESLEGLLNDHDESLDDTFPLDDDFDDELSATPRTQKSKSGAGKYIAYFAFLAVIGGGGYTAYKYLPNMLQNDTLMALQSNVNGRSATVEPQAIVPDTSSLALNTNEPMQIVEPLQVTDDLPIAMDDNADDIIVIDVDNDRGFGEVISEVEEEVAFEEKPAETIAEALEIAQTAEEEKIVIEDDVADAVTEIEDDTQSIVDNNFGTSFERVSAMPILKGGNQEKSMSLPLGDAVEEKQPSPPSVQTWTTIDENGNETHDFADDSVYDGISEAGEDVSEVETMEVTPDLENVNQEISGKIESVIVNDTVIESSVIEAPQVNETEIDVIEELVEEVKIPTAPVVEEMVKVEEKIVKPVSVKKSKSKSKEIVVNNKPLSKVDDRVTQARRAMENNDLQAALNLYQAVLADNPSSTAALTGMQLAKAKLRLSGQAKPSQPVVNGSPNVEVFPVSAPMIENKSIVNNETSVMAQMAANPRDALLAVKVAEEYATQGNKAKAVEYYRKALQLDVIYKSGLDRMAVYDALSTLQ